MVSMEREIERCEMIRRKLGTGGVCTGLRETMPDIESLKPSSQTYMILDSVVRDVVSGDQALLS